MARRGRKPNPKIEQDDLACLRIVRQIFPLRNFLVEHNAVAGETTEHGNTRLRQVDVLVVLLAAFFNPCVRSLRLMEQLSQLPWVRQHLAVGRACKLTVSDALERFNPQNLVPLINELIKQMPPLSHLTGADKELKDLLKVGQQIIAADGSMFSIPADVVWAMHKGGGRSKQTKRNGKTVAPGDHRGVRLNLQLDVATFLPVELDLSGDGQGSEPAAFAEHVLKEVIYLVDRNFVHFGFLNTVLNANSDFVLRLKSSNNFQSSENRMLVARDVEAGVVSDQVGVIPQRPGGRTGPPPQCALREVVVRDPLTGEHLRLLTSLLDVPAWVVAELYRRRWQVELFLRWLKVFAGYEHLLSHSRNGITTQFYVAVIGCLLMYVGTGRKVNKYALMLFGQVAAGLATMQDVLPMLERIEREKELERQRLGRKKAQKKIEQKTVSQLPG